MRALLLAWRAFGFCAHPLELALEHRLARGLLLSSTCEPLLLLLEPRRVVALPGNAVAAVELEDPAGDVVEEVAIVRDRDDGAGILLEECSSQRTDSASRWLVGSSSSSMSGFDSSRRHSATRRRSPPEIFVDVGVPRRQAQRVGGDLELALEVSQSPPGVDRVLQLGLLGGDLIEVGIGLGEGA